MSTLDAKMRVSRSFMVSLIVLGMAAGLSICLIAGVGQTGSSGAISRYRIDLSGWEYDHQVPGDITYHESHRFCARIGDGYYGLIEISWQPKIGPKRFDTAVCLRRGILSLPYPAPVAASFIGGGSLLALGCLLYVSRWRIAHAPRATS